MQYNEILRIVKSKDAGYRISVDDKKIMFSDLTSVYQTALETPKNFHVTNYVFIRVISQISDHF